MGTRHLRHNDETRYTSHTSFTRKARLTRFSRLTSCSRTTSLSSFASLSSFTSLSSFARNLALLEILDYLVVALRQPIINCSLLIELRTMNYELPSPPRPSPSSVPGSW